MQIRKIALSTLLAGLALAAAGDLVYAAEADTVANSETKSETKSEIKKEVKEAKQTKEAVESGEWTTFKESDGRASFSYPKSWTPYQSSRPGAKPSDFIITIHAPDNKENCNLTASPPVSNFNVHQYQETLDKYAATPAGSKMTKISDRFVTIDGQQMYERIWKSKATDGEEVAQFSFGVIKDRLYQIVLTCHYKQMKEKTALFERIGESLRVNN